MESKGRCHPLQLFGSVFSSHQHGSRNQDEMAIRMNDRLNVDPLKVRSGLQPVPETNSRTDGFTPACRLNAVMTNLAFDDLALLSELVIPPDSHEGAAGNPVRGLQDHRERPAPANEFLHKRRQVVKVILWPAARSAINFSLLQVHQSSWRPHCGQRRSVFKNRKPAVLEKFEIN